MSWMRFSFHLALGLALAAPAAFAEDAPAPEASPTPALATPSVETPKVDYTQIQPNDIVYGSLDAPNRIIEYASLSCSHCAHFHNQELEPLLKTIIDPGEATLIYRHYPLNEPALRAAQLVNCAPEELKKKFLKVLFKTQDNWAYTSDFVGALRTIAKLGGVDGPAFDACMKNSEVEDAVVNSRKTGAAAFMVQSTPTIIVNGALFTGPRSTEGFRDFFRQTGGKQGESSGQSAPQEASDNPPAPATDAENE